MYFCHTFTGLLGRPHCWLEYVMREKSLIIYITAPEEHVSLNGDWRSVKTFIILMRDISKTSQASTTLTILHLTLIAFLKHWIFFFTSRVSFYEAELDIEGAGNECGQESARSFLFARLRCQLKVPAMAFHTHARTHTSFYNHEYTHWDNAFPSPPPVLP